jgi:Fe-S cluster assembly protein SufD
MTAASQTAATQNLATQDIRLSSVVAFHQAGEPEFLRRLRAAGAERFASEGFPTTRQEEWKYTSLTPLTRTDFRLANAPAASSDVDTRGFAMGASAAAELVFVDGHFAPHLSSVAALPPGLRVTNIRDTEPALLQPHLGRYAAASSLTALNMALMQDGAFVEASAPIEGTVHLLYVSTGSAEPTMSHVRNLIVAMRGSELSVVESYVGSGTYFTNAVTEIVAEDGAIVDHCKLGYESSDAFHIGIVQIQQARSSSVTSRNITIGGRLVRSDAGGVLAGEGASLTLDGLYTVTGQQHVDNHTIIDHAKPHCESSETYKGILDERARGIFDGKIIVRKDAQKTNSRQSNKNLLLSESAIVDSKPTLEILADDVKCTHGSTVGQLDETAMFYLRSRGVGEAEARSMLLLAFASELVDRIKHEPVRERIRRAMFEQMPQRLPERRAEPRSGSEE